MTTQTAVEGMDRGARRRLETRGRLIAATRRIIASQGTIDAVPISEITEEADVGVGSFYNHFDSRDDLFQAVVSETVEAHGQVLDRLTAKMTDVAEVCAASVRLTVRMVDDDPVWGSFVVRTGIYVQELWSALGHRLLRDLRRGLRTGRFASTDEATALAMIAGAVFGVMQARLRGVVPDGADRLLAENVLRLLGLPVDEAAEIAGRPLPMREAETVRPATENRRRGERTSEGSAR
jgi:AcrR family transcriptional regulator